MPGTWNFTSKYSYYNRKTIIVYALLLSFIWHLVWCLVFKVDLTPKKTKGLNITKTVFLGGFLERTHIKNDLNLSSLRVTNKVIGLMERFCGEVDILPEYIHFNEAVQKAIFYKDVNLDEEKAEAILLRLSKAPKINYAVNNLKLEGPLKERSVVFMPPKPEIPEWMQDEREFNIKNKLLVDKNGRVVFVEQVSSSGYLEVDLLVKTYLKRLRFSDSNQPKDDDFQWGIITVELESLE